ncbi:hypothetical protein MKQ70_32415 [Chitinophaga sedimenti]|uniref:hypothetical protein n=1 Tax=Chitinophaga sedimenti TaxID=2033606 RepID=UPI0020050D1D|nr:hypothetical protein [Chitinophaga sedimenti]MCK7559422.1 hypothetical protein [Chitinophaga sedimenti]
MGDALQEILGFVADNYHPVSARKCNLPVYIEAASICSMMTAEPIVWLKTLHSDPTQDNLTTINLSINPKYTYIHELGAITQHARKDDNTGEILVPLYLLAPDIIFCCIPQSFFHYAPP